MRTLKIAFTCVGSFTHIRAYIDFFRARGHEVIFLAYDRPALDCGVPTYDISWGASVDRPWTKWRYFLAGLSARRLLRRLAPDILHGHYVTSASVVCLLSGFRPYVLTAHGSDLINAMPSPFWRRVLGRAFAQAGLVNTVSDQLTALALGLGVPEEKLLNFTFGVDSAVFNYCDPPPLGSPVRLLCTRRLEGVYDHPTLIRACEVLKRRGIPVRLTFAGRGPLQGELQELAHACGLDDEVRFMGGFDNHVLPALLHEHDFYVSASLWDGTSISLLEAMACGTFPVVSRIDSNLAWLEGGRSALMFDCHDAEGMAAHIERAAQDPELRKQAARLNRQVVEQRADRTRNLALLEQHYYRLAGAPTRSADADCLCQADGKGR